MVEYIRYADGRYRRPDGTPTGHIGNLKLALRPLSRLYARTLANEFNCFMLRACAVEAIADSIRPDPKNREAAPPKTAGTLRGKPTSEVDSPHVQMGGWSSTCRS
jgi:hypothetical protein